MTEEASNRATGGIRTRITGVLSACRRPVSSVAEFFRDPGFKPELTRGYLERHGKTAGRLRLELSMDGFGGLPAP